MSEKFDSMQTAFGGGDGEQYVTPPSLDVEVVPPDNPKQELEPAQVPAPELAQAPVGLSVEQVDHNRLREIGAPALSDLPRAFEAVDSLNRIIVDEQHGARMRNREEPSLLDGLYVTTRNGDVEADHYDENSLDRQIKNLDDEIKALEREIQGVGFLSSLFTSKKSQLEQDLQRARRNKNIASSRLGRVKEFAEQVRNFSRQIPSIFLPNTSKSMTLSDFLDQVQPELEKALELKKKYPKYKAIIGE